jgi:hypothetical protein
MKKKAPKAKTDEDKFFVLFTEYEGGDWQLESENGNSKEDAATIPMWTP